MKKYMAYSFGTLWTLVLIVALVATIIHQANFQASPAELNLDHQVETLESTIQELETRNQDLAFSLNETQKDYFWFRLCLDMC
jgi:cell division protein FtsL